MSDHGSRLEANEELRYRQVRALDPCGAPDLVVLLEALDDPSWRVQTAAAERLASAADPAAVLPALVAALGPDASPTRRGAAAAALIRIGAPALPAVAQGLASPAADTRTATAEILGQLGDRHAIPRLALRLADPDANVRVAAAEALGSLGGEDAISALQLAAQTRGDAPLQLAALDALARLRAALPAASLRALASDRTLRRAAYRLAGFCDQDDALPLLVDGLRDATRGSREAALVGMGQQRVRRGRGAIERVALLVRDACGADPNLLAHVVASLHADDSLLRLGALAVLEWAGPPAAAPEAARAAEDERVRALASDVLQTLGGAAAGPLLDALPRLPPSSRSVALAALARMGDARVLPSLCEEAASADEALRSAAVEALAELGDLRAVAPLARLLDDGDAGVSGAAAAALVQLAGLGDEARRVVLAATRGDALPNPARCRVLGRIGDHSDGLALCGALRAGPLAVRIAACQAIGTLASRGACPGGRAPELLEALRDPEPSLRVAAARAAGECARASPPWPEALRLLADALRDREALVRAAAAVALGRAQAVDHAQDLAALASDPAAAPEVAAAAVHALGEMGATDAAVLERAARHPDPEVVKEAVAAAAAVPGPAGSTLLLMAAAHRRWDVRRAAARSLARRGDAQLVGALRRLAAAEEDSLVAEALAEAVRELEARG